MLVRLKLLSRALPFALVAVFATSVVAFAEPAAAPQTTEVQAQWTDYGFHITAPQDVWPMLEILHQYHFDWELYSLQQRPTAVVWSPLPNGVYGQYSASLNVVRLSSMLQNESVELGTAFLAHELTHLTDDLNGKLAEMTADTCYQAETRAFVNEANFWQMVNGPTGKVTNAWLEQQENNKMFAFVGNSTFADLVLRTTPSYIKQCGSA